MSPFFQGSFAFLVEFYAIFHVALQFLWFSFTKSRVFAHNREKRRNISGGKLSHRSLFCRTIITRENEGRCSLGTWKMSRLELLTHSSLMPMFNVLLKWSCDSKWHHFVTARWRVPLGFKYGSVDFSSCVATRCTLTHLRLVVGRTDATPCVSRSVMTHMKKTKMPLLSSSCLLFADSGSITHWHWIKKWAVYNVDRNGSSQACQTIFCSLARSCQNRKLLFCFVGGF